MKRKKDKLNISDVVNKLVNNLLDLDRNKFLTYRHFRRSSGAVTAACYVTRKDGGGFDMLVGFSYCSPEDQFSKRFGRTEALKRLVSDPIEFEGVSGISAPLMKHLRECSDSMDLYCLGIAPYGNEGLPAADDGNFVRWFPKFAEEL